MSQALLAALAKLRNSDTVAGSALSHSQREALLAFAQRTGSVRMQPMGRGVTFAVIHRDVMDVHWRELRPACEDSAEASVPDRTRNIALNRDSKQGRHRHANDYLLLKAATPPGETLLWHDQHGHVLDITRVTRDQGAGALCVSSADDPGWHTTSDLWFVENQTVFDDLSWLPADTRATIVLYRGMLTTCLIDWLARQVRSPRVVFFPDYDGVGLLNYVRLVERLQTPPVFWLMPDWQNNLVQFGNNALWQKTRDTADAAYQRLCERTDIHPDVLMLYAQMRARGLGLEQEIVLLSRPDAT